MNSKDFERRDIRFEKVISYLLIIGVVLSLLIESIGVFLFYHQYRYMNIMEAKEFFIHGKNFFHFIKELFQGEYGKGEDILFMTLGITILILIPYIRVIMSVIYFFLIRNIKYVMITIFVLTILTISLMMD